MAQTGKLTFHRIVECHEELHVRQVEKTNAVQRPECFPITSTTDYKHNIPSREQALHPHESLGRRQVNAKDERKVEHEEADWRTNPGRLSDERVDGLFNAHDGAKEEKSLEVYDGRLLRDLPEVCTMGARPAHCRQRLLSRVHNTNAAPLRVLHDEEKAY